MTSEANALAKVYVDDINKDIDIYFFDRFSQLLSNYPELRVLFPATVVCLDNVPNYEYTTILTSLRSAFYKDLKNLPIDFTEIASLDTATCCMSAKRPTTCKNRIAHFESLFNTENGRIVTAALLVADGVINKTNMAAVLNNIATSPGIATATDEASNIIRLLNVFANSLTINGKWITSHQWDSIVHNPGNFISVLETNTKNANIMFGKTNISEVLSKIDINSIEVYVDSLVSKGYVLDSTFRLMRTYTTQSHKETNIAVFIGAFNQFFLYGTNYTAISSQIPSTSDHTTRIFYSLSTTLDIAKDVLLKDYQDAVLNTLVMVDSLMPTKNNMTSRGKVRATRATVKKEIRKKDDYLKSINDPDEKMNLVVNKANDLNLIHRYKNRKLRKEINKGKLTAANVDQEFDEYVNDVSYKTVKKETEKATLGKIEFKENLSKYGMLLATVVMADSSSQITAAIEAAAEPPGSSIVKKTTSFSIAVQGYGGISGGFASHNMEGSIKNFNSINPYAPLGISVSLGLRSRNPSNKFTAGSLSLFVSAIDIGSIVAYDFKNANANSTDTVSVKLANIFAPGANLVYGIPGMPLSIGAGFQYIPQMQFSTGENSLTTSTSSACRFQVFAAFDLSFFNLYVSKR